jgi:MFS family permease
VCLIYITTWLDRGNIGNAALMGIKEDIGLSASTYSLVVAMFFIGTCCGDLFTNIGMRLVRPSYWISGAMVLWGAIATLMAATYNPAGMLALRFFLGIGEAAFICGAPYVFTFWYPREEWGRRVCIYLAATPLAGAFGGWIVSCILLTPRCSLYITLC